MKHYSITILLSLCFLGTAAGPALAADRYGNTVVVPSPPGPALQPAVADLTNSLQGITGTAFAVTNVVLPNGIFVVRADSAGAPSGAAARLKGRGREAFLIHSKDARRLWIVANADEGLSHGIYFYLEQLGCRWLMPGDSWTILPPRDDVRLRVDRVVAPEFKSRGFFGTGGFGPLALYDPTLQMKDRWLAWQRRNRFGGEFALDGHVGETFNLNHKETLLKHPEYLAEVNGKREWGVGARLCPSNADAVRLWAEDRREAFRQRRKDEPDSPHSFAVSVDPSDGGGNCQCAPCKKRFASASDQVFFLANAAARAVRAEFPDGFVNLYAYADHSAVPDFPLEPNVYVMVIPYGFNYSGLSPDELIRAWGRKVPRLSLYDYWCIPDWSRDLPDFNYLETAPQKIRFWHQNHIEGFNAESTYSGGAMGAAWYLSSRLLWDPPTDVDTVLTEFYRLSFGPAEPPMRRMLERWTREFMLTSQEIGLSCRDVQEAMNRVADADSGVRARVDDMGRYVHYLRLALELENAPDAAARVEVQQRMVEHIFDIYDSAMIHSFRLYQLVTDYGRNEPVYQEFDYANPKAPGWTRVAPLTHAEVAALMADGARRYPLLDFEPAAYRGKLVPLQPVQKLDNTKFAWSTVMPANGAIDIELLAPPGLKTLPFRISRSYDHIVSVTDAGGRAIFSQRVTGIQSLEANEEMMIPLPKPGRYTIHLQPIGGGFWFQTRADVPLGMRTFLSEDGAPSPRLYFYVPRGLRMLAIYYPLGRGEAPVTILDPEGKVMPLQLHDVGRLITVAIPAGQDGKVWSLTDSRSPNQAHRMLTVPHYFAFSPTTLLVPEDALR